MWNLLLMKKSNFICVFIVFLLFFITACDKNMHDQNNSPICNASGTGDTVNLSYNKTAPLFASCYANMNGTVTKIMDSRCPKGAQCVWAGTVSAVLKLDDQFSITLDVGKQKDTSYNNHNFSFTLVNVLPYPDVNSHSTINDAKAIIRIVEK